MVDKDESIGNNNGINVVNATQNIKNIFTIAFYLNGSAFVRYFNIKYIPEYTDSATQQAAIIAVNIY